MTTHAPTAGAPKTPISLGSSRWETIALTAGGPLMTRYHQPRHPEAKQPKTLDACVLL
jgi:hypothetical protein